MNQERQSDFSILSDLS